MPEEFEKGPDDFDSTSKYLEYCEKLAEHMMGFLSLDQFKKFIDNNTKDENKS